MTNMASYISEVARAVGEKGFGMLLVVLSLPSALPVPAPGYSTPFGLVMALIALQMVCGRRTVWLPYKIGYYSDQTKAS